MRTKKYTIRILSIMVIAALASCSTAQYGYDDAYDHDYPVVYAENRINVEPTPNNQARNDYAENRSAYEEEDYTRYDNAGTNSRYNGSYSSRINRFHNNSVFGPSVSFGYFSNIYIPNRGFNNFNNFNGFNNNFFNSPFAGNNLLFYDPYQWHINNFHNPFWGSPFNNGFGFGGSPFFGNNINIFYGNGFGNNFCPTTYNPYFGNPLFFNEGVNNSSNTIYYGPRGNYNQYNNSNINQANENGTTNGNGNLQNQSGTFNRNGVQVKTIAKPNATPNNNGTNATPKTNTVPANASQPRQNVPRSNTTPKPRYNSTPKTNPAPKSNPSPRPRYNAPKTNPTPKPRFNSTPKTTPRPRYTAPKSNPTPRPRYIAPKSNPRPSYSKPRTFGTPKSSPSNGAQIRRTPK